MIKATFQKRSDKFVSYSVSGHANYAPHGQDIICAGVSALYTAVTNTLLDKHDATIDKHETIQIGKVKESQYIVEMLYKNLVQISGQYPDNLSVTIDHKVNNNLKITTGVLNAKDIKLTNVISSVDQMKHLRQKLI